MKRMGERSFDMNKLDQDEQKIKELFSQINVDSSRMDEKIKRRLHQREIKAPSKHYKSWAKSTVAAVAISMVIAVGATATVLGNFEWFMVKFNPDFQEIVEPIELHSEDQGIRMEVIGAQKYENRAIVYLSLQDTTGQNRLTENTDFRDGFNVKINQRSIDKDSDLGEISFGSLSWGKKMIHFDEETNTIYYEFNITTDLDTPFTEGLEVGSSHIYFDKKAFVDEPINIRIPTTKGIDTVSLDEGQIWGGTNMPENLSAYTALTPGNYASMPHGEKDQWVSNISIINSKLHVQIGNVFPKEFGSNDPNLGLTDANGNLISPDYSLMFFADENNDFLDSKKKDYGDAVYKYEEFVFSTDSEDLSEYNLYYAGSVYSGVEGHWMVAAGLSDDNQDIIAWVDDISVEGYTIEYMTLSPLGLEAMGIYKGECYATGDMMVKIETVDGIIQLEGGGGSQDIKRHTFSSSWDAEAPIDMTKVRAIVINDTRILIP